MLTRGLIRVFLGGLSGIRMWLMYEGNDIDGSIVEQ